MSNRWFRFYESALDDPKVQTLDGDTFKVWVNLLCLASKNDGKLPDVEHIAFALRCDKTVAERYIERLLNGGLIDRMNGGPNGYHYAPHGWKKRQYKSDNSTDRVKRFRERSKTDPETPPETETETETETEVSLPNGKGGKPPNLSEILWSDGLAIVTATGIAEKQARGLLGKWRKLAGDAGALALLADAQAQSVSDLVPWMEAAIRARGTGPPMRETREEREKRERAEWVERNYGPDSPRAKQAAGVER